MQLRARGKAAPDEVWDRYFRPSRWAEWSPQITGVSADPDHLAPGLTGTVHGPLGVTVSFVVLSVSDVPPERSWRWQVHWGPLSLLLHHTVRPAGNGTETTLGISGFLPAVLCYAPLAQLALVRLVRP